MAPRLPCTALMILCVVTRRLRLLQGLRIQRSADAAAAQLWRSGLLQLPLTSGTAVGTFPQLVASDGPDLWVANNNSGTVTRVRASDGAVLGSWTGATFAVGVLVARGRVYVYWQYESRTSIRN